MSTRRFTLLILGLTLCALPCLAFIGGGGSSGGNSQFANEAYHAENCDNIFGTNINVSGTAQLTGSAATNSAFSGEGYFTNLPGDTFGLPLQIRVTPNNADALAIFFTNQTVYPAFYVDDSANVVANGSFSGSGFHTLAGGGYQDQYGGGYQEQGNGGFEDYGTAGFNSWGSGNITIQGTGGFYGSAQGLTNIIYPLNLTLPPFSIIGASNIFIVQDQTYFPSGVHVCYFDVSTNLRTAFVNADVNGSQVVSGTVIQSRLPGDILYVEGPYGGYGIAQSVASKMNLTNAANTYGGNVVTNGYFTNTPAITFTGDQQLAIGTNGFAPATNHSYTVSATGMTNSFFNTMITNVIPANTFKFIGDSLDIVIGEQCSSSPTAHRITLQQAATNLTISYRNATMWTSRVGFRFTLTAQTNNAIGLSEGTLSFNLGAVSIDADNSIYALNRLTNFDWTAPMWIVTSNNISSPLVWQTSFSARLNTEGKNQ